MCEQSVRVENDQKINNRSVPNKENQGGKKCQKKKKSGMDDYLREESTCPPRSTIEYASLMAAYWKIFFVCHFRLAGFLFPRKT